MTNMMNGKIKGVGTLIDGSIHVILGGKDHTIFMTTKDTKDSIKGTNKFTQLGGEKLKSKDGKSVIKSFKYINIKEVGSKLKSQEDFNNELVNWGDLKKWVVSNIPKTTPTKNIRRRKGM